MAKNLVVDVSQLRASLEGFDDRANDSMAKVFGFQADRSTTRMKTTAPWTDRTTNARSGLYAKPFREGNLHILLLAHAVAYGIWLELKNSSRYAIVIPEMHDAGEDIMRMLTKLFQLMARGR